MLDSTLINNLRAWVRPRATRTRVVERQMDGCMAHRMSREDYGTVIDHRMGHLYPYADPVPFWLIHFDGDRRDEWYPKCFFVYQDDDDTWVRTC